MRKKITCLLLVLLSLSLLTVVGCGDEEIVISGVPAEIAIKATETDYDFLSGVYATKDGKAASVSVDKSEVKFGTSGEYTVKFTVGEETATAKVKIYGMPTYTAQDAEIGYGEDLTKGIVCKDSFGKDLELTHSEPEKDGEGRVLYKTHEITYTAQDAVGNVAEFKRKVTVVDNALTAVRDKTVDLADASVSWIVGDDSSVVSVKKIAGDKKEDVAASNYTFASQVGRFAFKPEYLATLATETAHEFDLTFSTGYKSVKITVTDSQDPKYTVDGDVDGLELCEGAVKLPETVKNAESYQKIDVEYLLNDQPITDLNPELEAGDYEFAIVYKRGGAEIGAARVEMNFTVLTAKDFYGREISGEKFLSMWNVMVACTNRPANADNRVEMKEVDGREVFDMINDLVGHGDDCRGFYLDMEYLDGIRQNTSFTHLGITFKFKVHKDTNGIKDANNNFFIDYYETDPAKYYDGQHRWRGGNSEYWGKADDMSEEWKTVNIPLNESNTSELFFLSESQGFYIEKIVPFERAAYAAEVKDTDAFGMEVAVQCGNDTLPNVKLFYNAVSDSADAALAATTVSVGNGIEVNGNITPAFTLADGKDASEWGAVDPQNSKRFTLPRLTDPTLGVHNHNSGKAYIRWQIVNGESTATLEIYYFFAKGNDGHADHSGTYEKVLSIGNLPKLNDGFAGFIVNGSKEKDPNLTEFMSFNGLAMAEEISSDGAVVDFNTQCARDDQYWSIRLFYNAKDKDLASAKAAPSVFFANGTGANKDLVKAENMTGTAAFEDPNEWGKTNAAENCYDFLQFRDAHLKAMHDGNSGRVYVRMAIFNEGNTATLKVYFDNRSNNDMGRGKQILALTVTGLDPVEDGFIGLMIDDSVFGSHWFEKNIYFTEGFAVSPYSLAYSENVAADTNKIAMTFGAQCGESIRDVRLFYNSAAKTVAGANASAGALFKGDVVSISATGDVSFADGKEWGSAFDGAAEKYNLLHMQKAHEKGYHDPDSGVVTVKIEIENDAEGDTATLKMLFKNPATGTFDLILTVSGMDKLASGFAGLIVDDDAISHKHIKDFALN